MKFDSISPNNLKENPFDLIGKDWMLITAGNREKFNTMTASWGGIGVLWNKNVSFSFVRPDRYTFEFLEKEDFFTLSFFKEKYRDSLLICGEKSGANSDKIKESGLTPNFEKKAPYFEEAKIVLICKKIYAQFIKPEFFIDDNLESFYPEKDYHKMFIGEIVKTLVNKNE